MTMLEQFGRHIPDPYPHMYLDGYTPYEILEATSRKMYNDHLERQEEKQISSELSEEGKRCFREYEEIQNCMMGISDKDIFINAFRLGVGMILDVIGEYEGQFYPYRGE